MYQRLQAKFVCNMTKFYYDKQSTEASFSPVYSDDPKSVNYSWSKMTPAGSLTLYITNSNAHDFFVPGKEYILTLYEDKTGADTPHNQLEKV